MEKKIIQHLEENHNVNAGPVIEELIKDLIKSTLENDHEKVKSGLSKLEKISSPGAALEVFGHLHGTKGTDKPPLPTSHAKVVKPHSFDNLVAELKNITIQRGNIRIKAVGTEHSVEWNDIGETNGVLIDMSDLNDVIEINRNTLNIDIQDEYDNRFLCGFEAGATMQHIQDYLWPLHFRRTRHPERYRILPNQTGCSNLSLGGSVATGAHGNGLTKPIIADIVLSFRLICIANNEIQQYQIEPENGISNREIFEREYQGVQLIQDDQTFNASLVNIGGMGIAYSYILRTEKAYYLTENRFMTTWLEAQNTLPQLFAENIANIDNAIGSLHSFEIFVNPYPVLDRGGLHVVILTLRYARGPPRGRRPDWHLIPHELVRLAFNLACEFMPDIVPFLMDLLMKGTCTPNPVTMNAVEALDPLSGLAVSGEVVVSECAMEAQNGDDVIQRIQALINLYQAIQQGNPAQLATAPFAVRFSQASTANMAMQFNRQSMMIISNILRGTPNEDNTLAQFRNLMIEDFNGRPHWGMVQDITNAQLQQLYPADNGVLPIQEYINTMQQLDPDENFINPFIQRVFNIGN